jgi:hypothetical protein
MTRVFTGTCLAALCAATLAAQTPAGQPPAASQPKESMKTVTVTGCLRAGEQPNTFVLNNAKWDKGGSGSSATGTSGTSAGGAYAAAGSTIKLVGAPAGVQLTEHVGHTVEVTGMVQEKEKSSSPSAAATPGEQTARSAKPEPTLDVRTVKMISSSCDAK